MKTFLITGAYGGMGGATVKLLKSMGHRVIALDLKVENEEENVLPVSVDITNEQSIVNAFNFVKEKVDKIDGIIHFAGIYNLNSLVEITNEDFTKIFDINVKGAYLINKTFLPLLKKGSSIILTTSELAPLDPLPFTGIYAVTKSALDKYAYSLRMELQLLGINVSVLRAGAVKTNMLGASTTALDKFIENTNIYSCNATRFKKIVDSVEAKNVSPEKIAKKCLKILNKKKPKFAYAINRNKLLLLLNIMPKSFQFWVIKKILK
ncbi:MAG: SDR family NAD(P)-dependent oxidoreductase [Clostridia bacterium]|nr:SDR family NAD(P)-dependent oxidoreductase [Clostridia bacterium]